MSYSSQILIEELAGPRRSVRLNGSTLPLMGAAWKGSQKMTTTWYPGNGDEATQQVLGPTEMPSKWNGDWRRTLMGRTPAIYTKGDDTKIVDPHILVELFEEIFRGGMRLRVTWIVASTNSVLDDLRGVASINAKKVREGRAKEWEFKYTRMQDVLWDIEFEWMGRGGIAPPRVTSTRSDTVAISTGAFEAAILKLKLAGIARSLGNITPSSLTLGQIEAFAGLPTAYVKTLSRKILQMEHNLKQITDIAKKLATQPLSIANVAVDLAHNTMSIANSFTQSITRQPPELLSLKGKSRDLVRAYKHFQLIGDDAREVAVQAQKLAKALQAQKFATAASEMAGVLDARKQSGQRAVQQVWITKDGDTPQRISMRFYGSPDHAVDILRCNRLPWHTATFHKGKILIIPVLKSVTGGA